MSGVTLASVIVTILAVAVATFARRDLLAARAESVAAPKQRRSFDVERLESALDATRLAVVVAGPDASIDYRNRAAAELLDAHDSRVIVANALRELVVSGVRGEPGEREVELFGPPSTTFLIRVDPLSPEVDAAGGVVAVVEDVSSGRRLDSVRRDFVANVSHELKTPVGAVSLLADALRGEAALGAEADGDVVRRLSSRVSAEMARLAHIVDDLLELSRIEAGDELDMESLDIHAVVTEAVARIANAAEIRGVSIVVRSSEGVSVMGDSGQLISAVANLVDNAVKYSPAASSVDVTVGSVGGEVRVEVVDHGVGIPARDLGRIFERFYRVDQARSRETGGTGLGLSIVRHIVANHGGGVEVESREGRGSTFALTLPVLQDELV